MSNSYFFKFWKSWAEQIWCLLRSKLCWVRELGLCKDWIGDTEANKKIFYHVWNISTFGVRSYRSQELCKRRFLYYLYIWCIVYPSTRVQFLNCSHYHKNTFTTFLHNISKHRFSFQCDIFSCISNSNISIQKTYITLTSLKAKMLNKFAFFIR